MVIVQCPNCNGTGGCEVYDTLGLEGYGETRWDECSYCDCGETDDAIPTEADSIFIDGHTDTDTDSYINDDVWGQYVEAVAA